MSSSPQIALFATGLWLDLGSPTDLSPGVISGWVCQPHTIGKLNTLLETCFSGSGYSGVGSANTDVIPDLTEAEFGILDAMYRITYYQRLVRNIAGGGGIFPVTSLSEGDSEIRYESPAALARIYSDNLKTAQDDLKYQVNAYIRRDYAPKSVDFVTILPQQYQPGGGYIYR